MKKIEVTDWQFSEFIEEIAAHGPWKDRGIYIEGCDGIETFFRGDKYLGEYQVDEDLHFIREKRWYKFLADKVSE